MTLSDTTGDLLSAYVARDSGGVDELVDHFGRVRPHWVELAHAYDRLGAYELRRRNDEIRLLLEQDGVTYNVSTGDRRRHRPWTLDAVPLVVPSEEWRALERGVVQRAELSDLILRDVYGERRLLRSGLIPPAMIFADRGFTRACDGIVLPGSRQLVVGALDLARSADRGWVALSQRTQAPSGAAYALENRRVLSRVFPAIFQQAGVQRLAPFVRALRSALRSAAPSGVDDPSIVILSPGPMSETAFEHASIAAQLGYPLVQGTDLEVREGRVWLRAVDRLVPVDLILRRVDDWFSDPLELRPDSTLGVPGLVDACRAGTVSVVNTLGSGVLENAALPSIMLRLSQELLGEDLIIPSAQTWWCGDPAGRSHVLSHLGEIIVRPLSRMSMDHSRDTRLSSSAELATLRSRIEARPELWVGQERIAVATAPMLGATGIEARPTVLRTFAVATSDGYLAMAGGLARTAGEHPTAPITNRAGALSKDVWIVGAEPERDADFWLTPPELVTGIAGGAPSARAAENLFWLGRYAERAESTVRLLRTVYGRLDEFRNSPTGPGQASLSALLESLTRITGTYPGFVGDDAASLHDRPLDELLGLVVDEDRPGTVAHAIGSMFDAIDVLRDQLSVDTWLVVGSLQRELDRLDAAHGNSEEAVTNVLTELLQGLLALAGLANESMVRDQAWCFMEAGRRIERAIHVVGLVSGPLAVERGAAAESLLLESVLMAGESIITYRRRYRSRARVSTVLDLLVLDPGNPRSLRFQVDALQASLAALQVDRPHQNVSSATAVVAELADLVHHLDSAELASADPKGRRVALDHFASTASDRLRGASDALRDEFFTRLLPQHSIVTPVQPPRPHW